VTWTFGSSWKNKIMLLYIGNFSCIWNNVFILLYERDRHCPLVVIQRNTQGVVSKRCNGFFKCLYLLTYYTSTIAFNITTLIKDGNYIFFTIDNRTTSVKCINIYKYRHLKVLCVFRTLYFVLFLCVCARCVMSRYQNLLLYLWFELSPCVQWNSNFTEFGNSGQW